MAVFVSSLGCPVEAFASGKKYFFLASCGFCSREVLTSRRERVQDDAMMSRYGKDT